tara:strand:+ start:160 stop:780 length:621 start_codon:yes stop_codon:yes gene_type:complete
MTDYTSDETLQQVHDEMYQRQQEQPKTKLGELSSQVKFFIGIYVAAIVILISSNKIEMNKGLLYLGIGAFLIWLLMAKNPERSELTWIECMIRINDLLVWLQKHPIGQYEQIPKGTIKIRPIGRKQWYEGSAWKRSFSVNIFDKDLGVEELYWLECDIYTGDIITFEHKPEGVYGNETKDIKLMPSYDLLISKKKSQYLDVKNRKV